MKVGHGLEGVCTRCRNAKRKPGRIWCKRCIRENRRSRALKIPPGKMFGR